MWKKRELLRESNLMIFRPYEVWKHCEYCAWLVVDSFIFAGKVVNCVISLQLLTDRIQAFRCARVTRILCTSIKTRRVVICRLQVAGPNLK